MSSQARPPIGDSAAPVPESFESFEGDPTDVSPRAGFTAVEQPTPTQIDERSAVVGDGGTPTDLGATPERSEPVQVIGPERSEPVQVISMKAKVEADQARAAQQRVPLHVQLRSLAEVSGHRTPPAGLGHLAPPRDPRAVRARRVRSNMVRTCVAIALAATIAFAIWFIAGG
jgi:hypothetical protein